METQLSITKGSSVQVVESLMNDTSTKMLIGKQGAAIKAHTGNLWTVKINGKETVLHSDELRRV